jgi:hypothetical protein
MKQPASKATRRYIPEYKTFLLDVLDFCSAGSWFVTRSLTLREEHRLRVFDNRALRRIFGPKRDDVIGGWRKLHNEELQNLYPSPNVFIIVKSRKTRWAGHVARMGEEKCI